MREILFRGKPKNLKDYKWVHGQLLYHQDNISKIYSGEIDYPIGVIPETVGQFTGMTDKNGKKIFEGDICKGAWSTIFQVVYDDCYLGFRAIAKSGLSVSIDYFGLDRIEVIGNIYDNPELLEVGK